MTAEDFFEMNEDKLYEIFEQRNRNNTQIKLQGNLNGENADVEQTNNFFNINSVNTTPQKIIYEKNSNTSIRQSEYDMENTS